MVCKKCNKRIRKDTPICPYCSTPQTEKVSLGAMSASKKKKKKAMTSGAKAAVIIAYVVSVLLIGGAAWLWLWNSPDAVGTTYWYERLIKVVLTGSVSLGITLLMHTLLSYWKTWQQILAMAVSALLLLGGFAGIGGVFFWRDALGSALEDLRGKGEELDVNDLSVNPDLGPVTDADGGLPKTGVINIALFGLDNRKDADNGRSDAIIILSIDRDHNKIKMSSIARDTMANVEGWGWNNKSRDDDWTKITHAFYHGANTKGKSGPGVAVKTLNENFGLNITKYAYVNFHEFAKIVDLVGGVEIDVKERELAQLNKHIRGMISGSGMKIKELTHAGKQNLSGGQALAYARLRKTDTDIMRGNRQKAVIDGVLKKARAMSVLDYPELIRQAMSIVNTNLTGSEILELGEWVFNNNPETVNFSLPDDEGRLYSWDSYQSKNSNAFKWYGSVYILDLDYASAYLRDFIYETNEVALFTPRKLTLPEIPAHMQRLLKKNGN